MNDKVLPSNVEGKDVRLVPEEELKDKTPKKDTSHVLDVPEPKVNMLQTRPDMPEIYYPFYANDARTIIRCFLLPPDDSGPPVLASTEHDNGLFYAINAAYHPEEIEHNTRIELQRVSIRRKQRKVHDEDEERKDNSERLFQAKKKAFDMEEVINTPHKNLKKKLRRSKSPEQVWAYVSAILALGVQDGESE